MDITVEILNAARQKKQALEKACLIFLK